MRLSPDLLARIEARAHDPRRRTHTAGLHRDAEPVDLDRMGDDLRRHGAPGAQGLAGLAGVLGKLLGAMGGAVAMGPSGPVRFGGQAPPSRLPPPASEAELTRVEALLGRALPEALRQLYAVGDGGFGPGGGLFSLRETTRRYTEHTREPFGPMGQPWPPNLLPLFDEDPVLSSLDLDSGAIVAWDPEEIEDLESDEDWARSFKPEYVDLGALMEAWLVGGAGWVQR